MKKILALYVTLTLLISFSFNALAESSPTNAIENGQNNGVGAGGTVFWSWGFMYRRHFANNFGFSANLGGWFDGNRGHIGNALGLLYTVGHHKFSWESMPNASLRVYLIGYLAHIYHRNERYFYEKATNSVHSGFGAGPGMEFFFNSHFGLHLELPWMTFFKIQNNFSFLNSYPHFGGGFVYYF